MIGENFGKLDWSGSLSKACDSMTLTCVSQLELKDKIIVHEFQIMVVIDTLDSENSPSSVQYQFITIFTNQPSYKTIQTFESKMIVHSDSESKSDPQFVEVIMQ